ncbi:MAG: alpha/beta hydrolase [Pseudomonadota bacterium]
MDAELFLFLQHLHLEHPLPRDPNDLAAYARRYEAVSAVLPEPPEPLHVLSGPFHLNVLASGEKTRLEARLYMPEGVEKPVLMVYFHGGGWIAGNLDTHEMLCRQICSDLNIAVASVHIPQEPGRGFLQPSEQALQALLTLGKARDKLSVNTERLLVGGDGSGAHLGLQAAWRMARQSPGTVDAVLAITPMVKPDFNTASYIRCASSLTFSRDDAVRSWNVLLGGRWQIWDERAVLLHGNQPVQRPPVVVIVAAEQDCVHDDGAALYDWLREAGARCEFYGAPGMPHDFVRLQHASKAARHLVKQALNAFATQAGLQTHVSQSAPLH